MQFDLKFALISVRDGYKGPGGNSTFTINNVAGYPIGTTTLTISGVTGVIQTGDTFVLAGDTTMYTVTAHVETTGNTTSVTINPPLVHAVTNGAIGTIAPHILYIRIGQGTLTYNETRKMEYVLDRGRLYTVRQGDEEPIDVRLDFIWEHLKSNTGQPPTVEEVIKNTGPASTWISSSPDPCEPYCIDMVIEFSPPCPGELKEIITLSMFRWESLNHDAKAGTIAVTGKCNITQALLARAA